MIQSKLKADRLAYVDESNVEFTILHMIKNGISVSSKNELKNALNKFSSTGGKIIVVDKIVIDEDITIPENVQVGVLKTGLFNVLSGATLTINGSLEAGRYQIFNGDGSVILNTLSKPVFTVPSMISLKDLDFGNFPCHFQILLLSFYKGGSPVEVIYHWEESKDKGNHNGITIIDPTHSATPGTTSWYSAENSGVGCWVAQDTKSITAEQAGAKGDSVNDDSIALQAAFDLPSVSEIIFRPVVYKINNTLTITRNNLSLVGVGTGGIIFNGTASSSCLRIYPTNPGVPSNYISHIVIKNLIISASGPRNSGTGIEIIKATHLAIDDLTIYYHPTGLKIRGINQSNISNLYIGTGNPGSPKWDNACIYITYYVNNDNSLTHAWTTNITNFILSANDAIQNCILIKDSDGISFTQGYAAHAYFANLQINIDNPNAKCDPVTFTNVYFDGVGTTQYGVAVEENDSSWSSARFTNCFIGQNATHGVVLLGTYTAWWMFTGCVIANNAQRGIHVDNSENISLLVTGCELFNNCTSLEGGSYIMVKKGKMLNVSNSVFDDYGSDTVYGINHTGVIGRVNIVGNSFRNFDNEVINSVASTQYTRICAGTGSPEGVVAAMRGTIYTRRDGGSGSTLYVKESGDGGTSGWVAK